MRMSTDKVACRKIHPPRNDFNEFKTVFDEIEPEMDFENVVKKGRRALSTEE